MQLIFLCRESTWSAASTVRGALWEEYCRHKQAAFKKICLESVWALPRETDYRNVCKMYLSLKTFVLLWKQPCDLLVINKINYHTLGAVLFCFLRRKPYILDVDDWEYRATGGDVTQTKTLFQRLGDRFALGAYAVVVASTFLKEYFSFCARVVYIPSCSLPDRDAPVPEPSESVRFCWMGMVDRFDAIDSVREILRVFTRVVRQYPGIRLVIIGKGIFEKELHRLEASDCLPQVQFHYAIDSRDIPAYLAKIDAGVLLFPEKNVFYQAKSPTRLFQFFAAGKPVIASAVGECPLFIRNGVNGFLVRSEDDLQAVMEGIGKNPGALKELSSGARATVQQWNLQTMARQLTHSI